MVKSLCRTLTRVSSHLKSAIYQGFQTINDYVTRLFSYFKYCSHKAFTRTLNTATRLVSFFYDIYPDNQNKGFLAKILLDFIFDMITSQLCGVKQLLN